MCTLHGRCTSRCSHLPKQHQGLARALTESLPLPLALATPTHSATPTHIATLTLLVSICLSARCQLFGFRICNELVGVDVVALHTTDVCCAFNQSAHNRSMCTQSAHNRTDKHTWRISQCFFFFCFFFSLQGSTKSSSSLLKSSRMCNPGTKQTISHGATVKG